MDSLRESTTALGVPNEGTWTTNVTHAVSKGYRAKQRDSNDWTMSAAGNGGITTAKDGTT